LFGITHCGGAYNAGTIFRFDTKSGTFKVLHSFASGNANNGANSLDLPRKIFYGVTASGGCNFCGTIFKFDTKIGGLMVQHNFALGDANNGASPCGDIILSGTNLYGMTYGGGANNQGTIFKFDTKRAIFEVLHSFGGLEGSLPSENSLTLSGTTLYGTTYNGGDNDGGTIFRFDTKHGTFNVLHSFTPGDANDGAFPVGSLTLSSTTLYGMTYGGGAYGYGTIFSIPR